ncbi:MAG: DNA repair protein RecN [Omnitrophica WOR_2 bacterium GWF2_43_52]|nr:MAG: DNA repair protein RecN [Omnitrophica WOR_2 bacterium GWF2_43_52]HAH20161.1 DNA repair protein RecN [Candidatus Omnitrophota bacterium]HBG63059.1 DNA repair protein RecN [Candidatus Omnitrophota bacterium]
MISQLTIKNFGLFDHITIEFSKGLNILSGETGAGKSILIDGLRYALGERLDPSQIRDPQQPCTVEAVFEISKKLINDYEAMSEFLPEKETSLIINRGYLPDGRNRAKINGLSVTLTQLKELGNHLLDFHGPHDHQLLLSSGVHLDILDRLSDIDELKNEYQRAYRKYAELTKNREELNELSSSRERDISILEHQIRELTQVSLKEEDYSELLEKQTRLQNSEKLYEYASQLKNTLENDESGISAGFTKAFTHIKPLNKIDPATSILNENLSQIQEKSDEMLSYLRHYLENLSFEPQEANEINKLCDIYFELKRKYGPGLEDVTAFYQSAKKKYDTLLNLKINSTELNKEISALEKELLRIAQKITKKRKTTADSLKETIEQELKELGIMHVRFECRIEKAELNPNGQDQVMFYISPNAGEDLKPLAEIVSSGEAARLMLALKKALIKVDPIPILIFDEIDAQIGGRLGTITGKKLKELSTNRQVILITHLPQIASFADTHFRIYKKVENNRTLTAVEELTPEARIKEIAKMMSGEKESAIAVTHAQEMLAQAK